MIDEIRRVYGAPTPEELATMFGHLEDEQEEETSFRDEEAKQQSKRKKRKTKTT